jgi:hypothetical protein
MEDMKFQFLLGMILVAMASMYGQKILDQFKK